MKEVLIDHSKEVSLTEFQEFQQAITGILGEFPDGDVASFTKPSGIARRAYTLLSAGESVPTNEAKQFYVDVPCPFDITELTQEQFQKLLATFGPDVMRAKMVSPTVLDALEEGKILPVGGACLIESWGEHLLKRPDIVADPVLRAEIAETIIATGPTYTQVTGTMLLGGEEHVGVMYREEFPWRERATEYGVISAKQKAHEAYNRIFAAVERRAQLIDPDFQLIGIHFDDLHLENGRQLQDRFAESMHALPNRLRYVAPRVYRPDGYNLGWVRYTYSGPEILSIVKTLAKQQGVNLDRFTLHTRTKQLDHFRAQTFLFDRELPLFKSSEQEYAVMTGLGLDYLQLQTHENGNGFVGFYDLTNRGDIVHQTVRLDSDKKILGKIHEEIKEILLSPLRLSAQNVDQHMNYLQGIVFVHSKEGRRMYVAAKTEKSLIAQEGALQRKHEALLIYQQLEQLLHSGKDRRGEGATFVMVQERGQAEEFAEKLLGVVKERVMQKIFKKLHIREQDQGELLSGLIKVVERDGNTFVNITQPDFLSKEDALLLLTTLAEVINEKGQKICNEITTLESLLQKRQREFKETFGTISTGILHELIDIIPTIFPIGNNPLVAHAIQLAFDPDMRHFVIDAATLEKSHLSEEEKIEKLYLGMVQIFPKLEAYLTFIMRGGGYPSIRSKKIYSSVL